MHRAPWPRAAAAGIPLRRVRQASETKVRAIASSRAISLRGSGRPASIVSGVRAASLSRRRPKPASRSRASCKAMKRSGPWPRMAPRRLSPRAMSAPSPRDCAHGVKAGGIVAHRLAGKIGAQGPGDLLGVDPIRADAGGRVVLPRSIWRGSSPRLLRRSRRRASPPLPHPAARWSRSARGRRLDDLAKDRQEPVWIEDVTVSGGSRQLVRWPARR